MKKLLILAFLLASAASACAQAVQQSGSVTPGHAGYWVTNGVLGDAGTAQSPVLTSLGTVGQGSTICANSGPTTGPYNQLCLAVNQSSAAQIILQNFGGATAQPMQFVINGTAYPFPVVNALYINQPDQTITGGANVTTLGLTTGNVTVDCGLRPIMSITDGGAFTVTAPINDGNCLLFVTNNASAGTISFSGFSVGTNTGDALDTTNGHQFTLFIWRANGISGYRVASHQ